MHLPLAPLQGLICKFPVQCTPCSLLCGGVFSQQAKRRSRCRQRGGGGGKEHEEVQKSPACGKVQKRSLPVRHAARREGVPLILAASPQGGPGCSWFVPKACFPLDKHTFGCKHVSPPNAHPLHATRHPAPVTLWSQRCPQSRSH